MTNASRRKRIRRYTRKVNALGNAIAEFEVELTAHRNELADIRARLEEIKRAL